MPNNERYVAKAYHADGVVGPPSAEVVLTPLDSVAPPVPAGVTAVPGSRSVILSWNGSDDRDTKAIIVYLATAPGGPYNAVNLQDPVFCAITQFVVMNLNAGQPYWFRITAKDAHGNESAYSAEVSATPLE